MALEFVAMSLLVFLCALVVYLWSRRKRKHALAQTHETITITPSNAFSILAELRSELSANSDRGREILWQIINSDIEM